jgi:hypothetical protein
MNHLWTVVQQLSQVLEENRAQTIGIVNGVQAIQTRAAEEGGVQNLSVREVNGELNGKRRVSGFFKGPTVAEAMRSENLKAGNKGFLRPGIINRKAGESRDTRQRLSFLIHVARANI